MLLRDKIIYILEKNRGDFVSGQDIANTAGVSRSAVAKCIGTLKNEGYPIRSVNNCGHSLAQECDILSSAAIRAHLSDETACDVRVFDKIDSTNTEAKRAISDGMAEDAIFIAEEQTAGRGRRGRSFFSPNAGGLYFSAVLHPHTGLADATGMTAAAAVAVAKAISEETKKDPKIKWVNDIFIDGKKVCGILTEAVSDFESDRVQALIVGIGINLTTEDFPEELNGVAGAVGHRMNRCAFAAKLFENLKALCDALPDRSFMDDYRRLSLVLGKDITFARNGIDYEAKAVDIHDDGTLEVITSEGEEMMLNSGEISIRLG